MPSRFCLSFRFLDPAFHGRSDGAAREWPPSPLRVFQSLIATAARRNAGEPASSVRAALEWLEEQQPPVVFAPAGFEGAGRRLSVPNNAMDIVARAWSRGNESNSGDANPATHRTMKAVRPTLLLGDATHYLWQLPDPVPDEVHGYVKSLSEVASSTAALGWGLDMVVGHGAIISNDDADALPGERWLPMNNAREGGLRVPIGDTLKDVIDRHKRFLKRMDCDGSFAAPPPLSVYMKINYRRATDPQSHSVAAFSLLELDASGFRAFDAARQALTVAGMMRGAAKAAATQAGWSEPKIDAFILGHGDTIDSGAHIAVGPRRFAYLPLPSIEGRGEGRARVAGSVRRVMLSSFADDCEAEIAWARRALSGQELIQEKKDQKRPVALLSLIPATEKVVGYYIQTAVAWATVTPVVLPGYDDPKHFRRRMEREIGAEEQKVLLERLDDRIDGLLRKAIVQAGLPQVLADHAEIEWRKVGFWPGTDLADRYGVPDHLNRFPRFHVKIQWRDTQNRPVPVSGPICLGGGRFYGLGLFAVI
jgi:CRISPR-associated protein Csb2